MPEHTEAPYSITFRTGKGNLFSVRGNTAEELAANLAGASLPVSHDETTGPVSVLDMIVSIEASLTGASPAGSSQGQGQQSQGSLNPACPTCGGATSEKSGTGSKGPWKGYFCNSGDKSHKVQWA